MTDKSKRIEIDPALLAAEIARQDEITAAFEEALVDLGGESALEGAWDNPALMAKFIQAVGDHLPE